MKSIFNKIVLFSSIILLGACSELLDIEAEGTISGDILTNEENIQQVLNGAYYNFGGIADGVDGGELVAGDFILIPTLLARRGGDVFSEIRWEFVLAPPSYQDFVNKRILNTNGRVAQNWRRAYETINMVNNILANIDNVEDETQRRRIRGESLAIRGILYFEMVRLWAPHYNADGVNPASDPAIPLRIDPITDINEIPELSAEDIETIDAVYNQAEEDLVNASTALESFGKNEDRLNYYACQAYLMRLHLQKGEYSDALDAANEIINSGQYSLATTPLDAFNNSTNSSEDIFAVQQTLANNAGDRTTGIGVTAFVSSLTESGLGTLGIFRSSLNTPFLFNSPRYASIDQRYGIDLSVNDNTTADQIKTSFYRNLANNSDELLSYSKYSRGDFVLPIVRLSEIYLSRAEASFEVLGANFDGQTLSDLNATRTRAGLPALLASDFADEFAFFDSLTLERNRELIYEGHLLHDLRRWRVFGDNYQIGTNFGGEVDPWDEDLILPIPQSELDAGDFED